MRGVIRPPPPLVASTRYVTQATETGPIADLQGESGSAGRLWAGRCTPCRFTGWPGRAAPGRWAECCRCCSKPAAWLTTELCARHRCSTAPAWGSGSGQTRCVSLRRPWLKQYARGERDSSFFSLSRPCVWRRLGYSPCWLPRGMID